MITVTAPILSAQGIKFGYVSGTQIDGISLGDLAGSYATGGSAVSHSSTVVSSPFLSSVTVGSTQNGVTQHVLLYSYEPLTVS